MKNLLPGHNIAHSYAFWFIPFIASNALVAISVLVHWLPVTVVTFALLYVLFLPTVPFTIIGLVLMIEHFIKRKRGIEVAGQRQQKRLGLEKVVLVVFIIILIIWIVTFFVPFGSSDSDSGNGVHCRPDGAGVSCG